MKEGYKHSSHCIYKPFNNRDIHHVCWFPLSGKGIKRNWDSAVKFLLEKPDNSAMYTVSGISKWLFKCVHVQEKRAEKETDRINIINTHCTTGE